MLLLSMALIIGIVFEIAGVASLNKKGEKGVPLIVVGAVLQLISFLIFCFLDK